jgi:hypothetical protein
VREEARVAAAQFQSRLERIKANILSLPVPQRLILAAEMFEEPGISAEMPVAIIRQALSELEAKNHAT